MDTLAAISAALRSRFAHLVEALATRMVRLATTLSSRVAALGSTIAHRAEPVAAMVGAGVPPSFALAAIVLVAVAGLPAFAHLALIGLKPLAAAFFLDAVLRHVPRHRMAAAGRGLRTAAAVGLLWLAAASFGAGQAIAPRPVVAATVPASATDVKSAFVTAVVPAVETATSAEAPVVWRAARARRLKAATRGRA